MKKKIIPVIISAVLFLTGLVITIVGAVCNNETVPNYPEIDLFNISESDVGKTFSGSHYVDMLEAGETEIGSLYLLWIYSKEDDSEVMVIGFDVPKSACEIFEEAMTTGIYSYEKNSPSAALYAEAMMKSQKYYPTGSPGIIIIWKRYTEKKILPTKKFLQKAMKIFLPTISKLKEHQTALLLYGLVQRLLPLPSLRHL